MVARNTPAPSAPSRAEAEKILIETAHAVKVMKASWLRVALNLKKIRAHELWRLAKPSCASFEDYAFGVLKLNRAVAMRMLQAMDYTEERRPQLIQKYLERGDEVDVPPYDVVNQLRRAEESFEGREDDIEDLQSMVFDEGAGRITLQKEIQTRLGDEAAGAKDSKAPDSGPDSLQKVIQELLALEGRLRQLKVSKKALKATFELIEMLQKEESPRMKGAAGADGAEEGKEKG